MIDHKREGTIHIVTLNAGPNVINPDWQTRMLEVLEALEDLDDVQAVYANFDIADEELQALAP